MGQEKSERFLAAFSRIEQRLRKLTKGRKEDAFGALLSNSLSGPIFKRFAEDLREFADLRNAIVHERGGGFVIAEPHEKTVNRLEQIERYISEPPTVDDLGSIKVITCGLSDRIGKAAKIMFDGKFSQLPVYDNGKCIGLLTTQAIAWWVAAQFKTDIGILEEASVEHVLGCADVDSIYQFVSRKTPIVDVVTLFERTTHRGKILSAVIITGNGNPNEKPLHILTVYDLPQLYRKIGFAPD